jgi:predicted transcriptional regulator
MPTDAEILAAHAEKNLCLQTAQLSRSYYYQSLPFCIVDAIFSLGVRYRQVENVVCHVHKATKWPVFRRHGTPFPPEAEQIKVAELLQATEPPKQQTLFHNRGYANPAKALDKRILKSDLVRKFAEVLIENKVNSFQSLISHDTPVELDQKLCDLPALRSGIAVRYFRMLAGDESQVKPDRMIQRFIQSGVNKNLNVADSATLVQETCGVLKQTYSSLTPRLLDHEIWKFQRSLR